MHATDLIEQKVLLTHQKTHDGYEEKRGDDVGTDLQIVPIKQDFCPWWATVIRCYI